MFTRPTYNARPLALKNARLIDPETGLDEVGTLLVKDGKIADFGAKTGNGVGDDFETLDCGGHVLCPGLLDIQVHFREPGFEYKETIETGSRSAVAGGVTTVALMPNTKPVIDDITVLSFIQKQAREYGYCNVKSYAAISKGQKGEEITEMGLLAEHGAVGFTDDGLPVMNAQLMRQALTYSAMLGVPVAQHAEDHHLSNGGCMNEGLVATKLGLKGIPNISEAVIVARDVLIAELTGGQYHVLHVSTAESVDVIRWAKARGIRVTAEAAPHHFLLTDENVIEQGTLAKMNPPLRADKDRIAIIEGMKDGTIDAIATDHAPHDVETKNVPMAEASYGLVGLETMLPLSLNLYHNGTMGLRELLAAMTYKPADIIHVESGRLRKGAAADLTLIDLDHRWVIDPQGFMSKSKNTPFAGWEARGRAIRTIVAGETVYSLEN